MWRCMAAHGHAESEPSLREALARCGTSLWLSGVAVGLGLHGTVLCGRSFRFVRKFPRIERYRTPYHVAIQQLTRQTEPTPLHGTPPGGWSCSSTTYRRRAARGVSAIRAQKTSRSMPKRRLK